MSAAPENRNRMPSPAPRGIAASLALILAVAALLLAGAAWYRLQQAQAVNAALQAKLDSLQQNAAMKDDLAGDAADTQASFKTLTERVDQLDAGYGELRKHSEEGRDAWIKAEAASLLVAANEDAQLRADPALALKALEQADARLKLLTDPRLIAVRQEIAREQNALRALPQADLEGMALTLTELAGSVDRMPLKQQVPEHYQPGAQPAAALPESAGFWERFKAAASRLGATLFTVRRHNMPLQPLLAPQEEFLLRRNLELRLESTRSALLEREGAAFQSAARAAETWLQDYFDAQDAGVKAAVQQLDAMQKQNISPKLPDLSASLGLLRKLEAPQGAAP